ncbi:MAG: penicillin-binding protein 2 [Rhizobacter sp.]|nr:penicillin-binding protein 2 [Chlorobiales bacterium]
MNTNIFSNAIRISIVIIVGVLLGRLFYLQIIQQAEMGDIAGKNSVRRIPIDPARGVIYDRNGTVIVDNRAVYTAQLVPSEFDRSKLPLLSELLGLSENYIKERIRDGELYNRFAPVKIRRDLDFKTLARLEENRWQLAGVDFVQEHKRAYPVGAEGMYASHIFGYTKTISKKILEKLPKDSYSPDDLIGYSGLEKMYEPQLRGQKGFRLVTVNSLGKQVSDFGGGAQNIVAANGNDLLLTIDAALQAQAESLLVATGKSGAIVAMNPQSGEVLALVSKPDYDPNVLSGFISGNVWGELVMSPQKPLFNRAVQTRYPPGSTYKMVSALAGLQEGIITPQTIFSCSGHFRFGDKDFLCHEGHGHGAVDVTRAIQVSCNSFFYQLMLKNGFDRWTRYGRQFGFGAKTGIDIPDEQTAILPSIEYFNKKYGPRKIGWTDGFLISLSIGQGDMGASPMQMACYAATLGNGGTYYQPHLVQGYRDRITQQETKLQFAARAIPIDKKNFDVVRNGMRLCVESGTGRAAAQKDIVVSGKTGTAQNPHGENHAWFICFAPYDKPTIALCVMVENAGQGGRISAPITGKLLDYYFHKTYTGQSQVAAAAAAEVDE